MNKNIREIYFSPSGRTKKLSELFVDNFNGNKKTFDFFLKDEIKNQNLGEEDLLIVTLPVYAGRIPKICVNKLKKFKGNNTPAIALVAYGNRDYDDALLELSDILKEQGFKILGAAAFITRHSIFPEVAENRPDEEDEIKIKDFANKCKNKLESLEINELEIKGNRPYKEGNKKPLMPTGDELCINCGKCVRICPVEAISKNNPRETDKDKCINCTACIYNCPTGSRTYHMEQYKIGYEKFKIDNAERKEPEIFI